MITKFTFPTERTKFQSVGKLSTSSRLEPKSMANEMLFWGDLYTIVYNFLNEDIEDFEDASEYFKSAIDFDCVIECKDKKINIASAFYFYFD